MKNCEFTRDRTNIEKADLVLVHMLDVIDELPSFEMYKRPAYQRWVFSVYESPVHSIDFSKYDEYFNLTSTYKMDSTYNNFYQMETGETIFIKIKSF